MRRLSSGRESLHRSGLYPHTRRRSPSRGVAFVSLKDNVDLSTPSGRLMFQIIGAMAEFERSLITERVRAGLRNAQAKGRPLGRPRVALDVARAIRMRTEGVSYRSIAAKLGVSVGKVHAATRG